MCGRYVLRGRREQLAAAFLATPVFEEFTERPHFNLAPSQHLPVVRLDKDGHRAMGLVEWGLVPSWNKGQPKARPINARCETVASSGMFRDAFNRRRCLVPADGFYEWQGRRPPKQPWFIHRPDDAPFAFAGLWERWKPAPDAEPVDTFTIITTTANELMKPIHERMPVILRPEDYERWLDRGLKGDEVADLLKPADSSLLEARPVSTLVNSVKNDGPELIAPADEAGSDLK